METLLLIGAIASLIFIPLAIYLLVRYHKQIKAYDRWYRIQMEAQEEIVKMICEKHGLEVPPGTRMPEELDRKEKTHEADKG